jgi:hypothetical protein
VRAVSMRRMAAKVADRMVDVSDKAMPHKTVFWNRTRIITYGFGTTIYIRPRRDHLEVEYEQTSGYHDHRSTARQDFEEALIYVLRNRFPVVEKSYEVSVNTV